MRISTRFPVVAAATIVTLGTIGAGVAGAAPGTGSASGFTADLVGTNGSEPFSCGLNVTNNGPATARNVTVLTTPGLFGPGPVFLGDIAPGQSKKKLQIDCGIYARQLYQYAVSTTPDLNPGNNGAVVFTPIYDNGR
ncbi:hypothetical protein [Williamsia maris]|uniref:Secreted protein n=1 Tax=Williamsia maris TaxID=72806 RepID=A0ABT1HEZ7_9NOCA|nr:hypothetical protein [Williamsia maris]MCP2176739.1 hypothetical protein [Williamsia maris]